MDTLASFPHSLTCHGAAVLHTDCSSDAWLASARPVLELVKASVGHAPQPHPLKASKTYRHVRNCKTPWAERNKMLETDLTVILGPNHHWSRLIFPAYSAFNKIPILNGIGDRQLWGLQPGVIIFIIIILITVVKSYAFTQCWGTISFVMLSTF
jgi:hypothetical protein